MGNHDHCDQWVLTLRLIDDALLIPAGLWLMARLLPAGLLDEHRATARAAAERPVSVAGIAIVVAIWIAVGALAWWAIRTSWD